MTHSFLPRKLANAVKKKGFFGACIGVYVNGTDTVKITDDPKEHYYFEDSAPQILQVVDWFRETHDIHIRPLFDNTFHKFKYRAYVSPVYYRGTDQEIAGGFGEENNKVYDTPGEAYLASIKIALKLIG